MGDGPARRLTRRNVLKGGLALGMASGLGTLASPRPAPAAAAAGGGGLTVGLFLDPNNLDPAGVTYSPAVLVLMNVVESLVEIDQNGKAHPRLATSWKTSPDGREWTFTLREGIMFHDGTPFDAQAVKFTFDRIVDPATKSQTGLSEIGPYESSTVIDPKTVKLTFKEPYAPFLFNVSDTVFGIVSPTAVKKYGQDFTQNPVGTGPYMFKEWVRNDHVSLVRNDKYVNTSTLVAHQGAPYLNALTFRIIPEDQTRLDTLRSGESDFIQRIPAVNLGSVQNDPKYQLYKNMYAGDPVMFLINRQLAPTDDLAVAQAIQFAVDKSVITKIGTAGTSSVAWGPLKPVVWGYNADVEKLYKYDPAKARELLEGAGWKMGPDGIRQKDGRACHMVCAVKSDPVTESMLGAAQGMLKGVGIALEINAMALPASEELGRQGKSNMTFMEWKGIDPDILTVHFHSKNIGGWNMGHFKNAEVDQLLDTGRTTLDPQKRLPMYHRAQSIIMQQAATLPLFNLLEIDGAKAGLQGVTYDVYHYYPKWYDARVRS